MSEVTIEGLDAWLEQAAKLGERAEAANDKYRSKTADEAQELIDDSEEMMSKLQQMAELVESMRDALQEVVSNSEEYPELDRSEKEAGREAIACALEDLNSSLLAWPWDDDEETE